MIFSLRKPYRYIDPGKSLYYQFLFQFSKNRRQRLMDQRVSKNITKVKADQEKLKSLTVSAAEMDQLSQDATEFFFCVLSQCSVKDVLLNKDDVENAIGFGLAVRRPEHALDAPTAVSCHRQTSSGLLFKIAMLISGYIF